MRSLLKGFHYGDYSRNGEFGKKKRKGPGPGPAPVQQKNTSNEKQSYYGLPYSVYTATPMYPFKSNICKI
jgi:hypothetical protein